MGLFIWISLWVARSPSLKKGKKPKKKFIFTVAFLFYMNTVRIKVVYVCKKIRNCDPVAKTRKYGNGFYNKMGVLHLLHLLQFAYLLKLVRLLTQFFVVFFCFVLCASLDHVDDDHVMLPCIHLHCIAFSSLADLNVGYCCWFLPIYFSFCVSSCVCVWR